jgi:hypothetical protein
VSSSALKAASKASSIAANASGSNSPGVTKERIDIAAPSRAQVDHVPLTCDILLKVLCDCRAGVMRGAKWLVRHRMATAARGFAL